MDFSFALSTVLSTLGTLAVLYVLPLLSSTVRTGVDKYVSGLVQHRFDKQIETVKSELRKTEEELKSELRAKEQQINSIINTMLSIRSSRHVALDARRLTAVERLWAAKTQLDGLKYPSAMLAVINYDVAVSAIQRTPQAREAFRMLGENYTPDKIKDMFPTLEAERPFIDDLAWAYYATYQSIIMLAVVRMSFLASGIEAPQKLTSNEHTEKLVRAALPEYAAYIDKNGVSAFHYLLDPLETKLLRAVRDMLDGKEADAATIAQTSKLVSLAQETTSTSSPNKVEVPDELKAGAPKPPK